MQYQTVKNNTYADSVTLMLYSSELSDLEGVAEAAVMMGTKHNIELLTASGLFRPDDQSVSDNDMIIAFKVTDQAYIPGVLAHLEEYFADQPAADQTTYQVRTIRQAKSHNPDLNLLLVSTPGKYAAYLAKQGLENDMHVMIFSDNVSLSDEVWLKQEALKRDRLLMGPDCGTALINGVALGFANVVSPGRIGLISASGTGLQEVSSIIDRAGGGISQGIGCGGRDLSQAVAGRTTLYALKQLQADEATDVIGLISKPPAEPVVEALIEQAKASSKPVVFCLLGADAERDWPEPISASPDLSDLADKLLALSGRPAREKTAPPKDSIQRSGFVRGLYTGGTLAYEALVMLSAGSHAVYSNIALDEAFQLRDPNQSKGNTIIDLGDDFFTDGQAHPMIDPRNRHDRIIAEAGREDVAIILLDCVLGYGSHPDPAGEIVKAVQQVASSHPRPPLFVASVTGTHHDRQNYPAQQAKLRQAGVMVFDTNAEAVRFVDSILKEADDETV